MEQSKSMANNKDGVQQARLPIKQRKKKKQEEKAQREKRKENVLVELWGQSESKVKDKARETEEREMWPLIEILNIETP